MAADKINRRNANKQRQAMCGRPLYPIGYEPAPPANETLHPILSALPAYREPSSQITYYAEKFGGGFFWAERLSQAYRHATPRWEQNFKYSFSFDNGRVRLYSNCPWPDDFALDDGATFDEEARLHYKQRQYVSEPPFTIKVTKRKDESRQTHLSKVPITRHSWQHDPYASSSEGDSGNHTPAGSVRKRSHKVQIEPGSWKPDPYDFDSGGDSEDYTPAESVRASSRIAKGTAPSAMETSAKPPPAHNWTQLIMVIRKPPLPGGDGRGKGRQRDQRDSPNRSLKPPVCLPSSIAPETTIADKPEVNCPTESTGDAMDVGIYDGSTEMHVDEPVSDLSLARSVKLTSYFHKCETLKLKQAPPTVTSTEMPTDVPPSQPPTIPVSPSVLGEDQLSQREEVAVMRPIVPARNTALVL
jgi:hypothetical protein